MRGPDSTKIKSIFSDVAAKYDKANQVLSLGIHHLWRKKLVEWAHVKPGDKILDCATGTGDVAIAFQKKLKGTAWVTGIDFCDEMLIYAPQKASKLKLPIDFKVADVTQLPFSDNEFDVVSISFGIRNVENPVLGIQEMTRVLKPGGRLLILEFGQVQLPVINLAYNWYSKKVLPKIGGWITHKPDAYQYLQESSARFPCGQNFINLMKESQDLSDFQFKALSFGIAYLYRATKKPKETF
jgi:demethylmenaquinone methyltransferase/2-methoxy-6-polyprenyl-1,4-benzoquinol methylase